MNNININVQIYINYVVKSIKKMCWIIIMLTLNFNYKTTQIFIRIEKKGGKKIIAILIREHIFSFE